MRHYSKGGVVQQRGRWKGLWYEDGVKKSRILGLVKEITKTEAREAVAAIVAKLIRSATSRYSRTSLRMYTSPIILESGRPARAKTTSRECGHTC